MNYTTACPDWQRRILARESLITMPILFPAEARAAMRTFGSLMLPDVPGRPTLDKAAPKWARQLVSVLMGSYDGATGIRHLQELMLLISKKNGKSSYVGAAMLTALIRNPREQAEFLICAPTIEAANNSYNIVRGMVRADAELSALLHVRDQIKTIEHRETGASMKVLAADSNTVAGKRPSGVLIDELWAFGKSPRARDMVTELVGGLASRPEGFVWYCSTMSDEAPAGVFLEKLAYARDVRDGNRHDRRFLPLLFEFPRSMIDTREHLKPANFYITNPSIDVCVSADFLERELGKAQASGEAALASFTSKHLNVQPDLWLHGDAWAGAAHWSSCGDQTLTLDRLIERCESIVLGIDGGGGDDLLAAGVLGRVTGSDHWLHWAKAWCKSRVLERYRQHAPKLRDFEADGDLVITDVPNVDIEAVADLAAQLKTSGKLSIVAVDPAGIAEILAALDSVGIDEQERAGVSQGWRLTGAIKSTERHLIEGAFTHCAQPMMAWCVGNAKLTLNGNGISITKQASSGGKIDPLIALLTAAHALSMNIAPKKSPEPSLFFF